MMGDGETCEGEIWEAAQSGSSYKLGNLIGIVDRNRQMMTSFDGDYINQEPYAAKWMAFGWEVVEIDGHNMNQIIVAFDALPEYSSEQPVLLLCNTVKGKGVSFMERNIGWHAGSLTAEDAAMAIAEIEDAWTKEKQK
jgi:transketolase